MSKSNKIREKLGLGPLKKPLFGHNRSHAMNATQKISKPTILNNNLYLVYNISQLLYILPSTFN